MPTYLLKLSGEALGSGSGRGLEGATVARLVRALERARREAQLGIVLGGGNFWRGREADFLDRVSSDQIGMLATVLNGLALQAALEGAGVPCALQSVFDLPFAERHDPRRARAHLQAGRLVLFVGGTGNPLVTTDTAAAIRAVEIGARRLLKGSTVDGVYSADPRRRPDARRYETLSFAEAIEKRLAVMDLAALELCRDHGVEILVFDAREPANLLRALVDPTVGTLVR